MRDPSSLGGHRPGSSIRHISVYGYCAVVQHAPPMTDEDKTLNERSIKAILSSPVFIDRGARGSRQRKEPQEDSSAI